MPAPQLRQPPQWTPEELARDRQHAIEIFRKQRVEEPLETYGQAFDQRQGQFEVLLEQTVDLTQLGQHAIEILTTPHLRDVLRYLAGPPISEDDLKTLAEAPTFTKARLQADPAMAKRLIDTVLSVVDVRRFPWLSRTGQHRDPDPVERDSASHVLLFSRYIANHPQEAAMMGSLPLPTHPRVMMLLIGPVIGVASGLVLGLFAVIAAKVVPARTKAALGQG